MVEKSLNLSTSEPHTIVNTEAINADSDTLCPPMIIFLTNFVIPHKNGGQKNGQTIINNQPRQPASTWYGAMIQSVEASQNSHFIGHNPSIFSSLFSLVLGIKS